MNINCVALSGNLTKDPELRQTSNGMSVLIFDLAFNTTRKENGEWKDYPNYIECTIFGARAESVSKIMSKGTPVSLTGKLNWSSWQVNGQTRSKISVVVDQLDIRNTKKKQNNQPQITIDNSDVPF